jgi:hypothetical protein
VSKPIDAPDLPVVPLWDDSGPDDLSRPDASFHDDHVGGRLKAEEAARQRAVSDRFLQQQPKRIIDEGIKVVEAGAFRPAHEDEQQKRARREGNRQARQGRGPRAAGPKPITQQEMDVARIEARVEVLLADMQALHEAISAAQEDILGEGSAGGNDREGTVAHEARLLKLEREAKFQLQHLIAGGVGMTFLADPRLTFRRLFARIAKWPVGVRPGFKPESDADIDAFLAWVFEPDGGYATVEPF